MLTKLAANKKVAYILAAAVLAGIGGGLWWRNHNQAAVVVQSLPLVRVAVVQAGEDDKRYVYSGEVRGRYESPLSFRVGGKIIQRNVQAGSVVRPGDVLMQLDPKDLQQTVNSTSAQVASAESQLKLAETNLSRYQQLYEQNAVSRATLDQYQNAYEVAQASTRQAYAQYAQGSNQLDYSLLQADKPGVVSAVNVEAGQVVSAGQTVLTVVQDGEREVEISVPENRLDELRRARQLQVSFWALPNVRVAGQIREISPMADQTTRTYKVRVSLVDPPADLKLGMTASVAEQDAAAAQNAAIFVPLSALYQLNETPNVWVIQDNVATLRPVSVGAFADGKVQILSGLKAGDVLVTAGVHKLHENQKVRTMEGERS